MGATAIGAATSDWGAGVVMVAGPAACRADGRATVAVASVEAASRAVAVGTEGDAEAVALGAVDGVAAGTAWTTGRDTLGPVVEAGVPLPAGMAVVGAEVIGGTVLGIAATGALVVGVTDGTAGMVDAGGGDGTGRGADPVSCASKGVAVKASAAAIAAVAGRME